MRNPRINPANTLIGIKMTSNPDAHARCFRPAALRRIGADHRRQGGSRQAVRPRSGLTLHPDKTRTVDITVADGHFDFLGYRFQRSRRGKMMRLVRSKSLRKLRESIKTRTRRNNGMSMEAIVADLNRTLPGWFGYCQHVKASQLGEIDGWIRMRPRSILRKRRGLEGRGRGKDHQRWRHCYFNKLGLFCLLDAREAEFASLRNGANC